MILTQELVWEKHPECFKGYTSHDLIARIDQGFYEIASAQNGYYLFFNNKDLRHKKDLEELKGIAQNHYRDICKN